MRRPFLRQARRGLSILLVICTACSHSTSEEPPTLGLVWANAQHGYGDVKPPHVFNGGDPTGEVTGITWRHWGGSRAVGRGTGWVSTKATMASAEARPAVIVAFDLGDCRGTRAYRKVEWYFPSLGDSFDGRYAQDVCPEDDSSDSVPPG